MLLPLMLACSFLPDASSSPLGVAKAQAEAVEVAKVHTKAITSSSYHIDDRYPSMRGPYGFDTVTLHESEEPELLWITGYRTTVVDAKSEAELSQEFMCHANLDFDPQEYYARFPTAPPISGRLFTLSQGQQDIAFPKGFGIPVTSDMPITLATQVLNLNIDEADLNVKHKVEIDFVRDAEVKGQMVPLFQGAVEGFKALEDARYYGFSDDEVAADDHGQGCSVGQAAIAGDADEDGLGQKFTAHWVVPPGEEVNVTNVTRFLNLPYDTRAHYIAVHLHPFAESLVLKDRTTGEIVFASKAEQTTDRVGLKRVEYYTSTEGLPLYADHQYELVSKYNNTSGEAVDSMAVMYLYMHDRRFEKPILVSQSE